MADTPEPNRDTRFVAFVIILAGMIAFCWSMAVEGNVVWVTIISIGVFVVYLFIKWRWTRSRK